MKSLIFGILDDSGGELWRIVGLQEKPRTVSEWTGLSGKAKSVKRFERSNRLDTALYKNYLFFSGDAKTYLQLSAEFTSSVIELHKISQVQGLSQAAILWHCLFFNWMLPINRGQT